MRFSQITAMILLTGSILALTGCASGRHTTGEPIRDDDVASIMDGKWTVDDIIRTFGAPTKTTPMGDRIIYHYEYKMTKTTGVYLPGLSDGDTTEYVDRLTITFDKNNVVSTHRLSRGVPGTRREGTEPAKKS